MFAGLKAVFTKVKVIAVSALEPGAIDGEHLAAVTPVENTNGSLNKTLR